MAKKARKGQRKDNNGEDVAAATAATTTTTTTKARDDDYDDLHALLSLACSAPWPPDVFFLAWHSQPSRLLAAEHQLVFCVAPRITHEAHPQRIRRHGWTQVRAITADTACHPVFDSALTTHPAVGQFGLFARKHIPPHTLVVPYLGVVHNATSDDEDVFSRYDAAIEADDGTRLGIDATKAGCEARFVNDYRGILPRPNLFFQSWQAAFPREVLSVRKHGSTTSPASPRCVRGLALYSGAHAIRAGTELCVSYGKGWWAARTL